MRRIASIFLLALLVSTLLYLAIGLGFHFAWKSALEACRQTRAASGEFVEPEMFSGGLGLLFDISFWPVYSWANTYHFGSPFSTPCSR